MPLLSQFTDEFRLSYNGLPSVEDASERLHSRPQFANFLSELGTIGNQYGLNDRIGAFLLHRHFEVEPGEIMLESPLNEDGIPVLVTRPVGIAENVEGRPTRWLLSQNGTTFHPLEYSTDHAAIAVEQELQDNEAFLNEYASLLRRHGVQDLLGLCVAERAHVRTDETSMFVEVSRPDASVIATQPKASGTENLLTTVWVPSAQAGCMPTFSCQWYCWKAGEHHGRGHRPQPGPHNQV